MVPEGVSPLKVAELLDKAYFSRKERVRSGARRTRPAVLYTDGLFDRNQRRREGYENSLSGYLAEVIFVDVLAHMSPNGYNIELSGKKMDHNNGCDVIVKKDGHTIGGFNVKSGRASYDKKHPSRIKEFPVMNVLMEHLGAKTLITSLQQGKLPDVGAFVAERLGSPEGKLIRAQLHDQFTRHAGSLQPGAFREYVGRVAEYCMVERRL